MIYAKKVKKSVSLVLLLSLIFSSVPAWPVAGSLDTGVSPGEGNSIEQSTVIGLGQSQADNDSYLQHAYQYIFNRTLPYSSDLLLYPENFSFTDGSSTSAFDGAIFKLRDDSMPADEADVFNYLQLSTDADLGRARALYDGHIGILDISREVNGQSRHLTFESESYCHLLHTYLGKHEQCFHGFSDYQEYLQDDQYPNKEASSLVMLGADDVRGGKLMSSGLPFFQVLILPDLTFGLEESVITTLGNTGLDAIRSFVNNGGSVISSGKSSRILEAAGILADGTVDPRVVIKNKINKGLLSFADGTDFESRLMRLGLLPDDGDYFTYFLSSSFIKGGIDPDLIESAWLDLDHDSNYIFQDNTTLLSVSRPLGTAVASGFKKYGQGHVYILAGQPASGAEEYYPLVFNTVMGAMARDMIADLQVTQKTNPELSPSIVPALESNVYLAGSLQLINYFDQPINDIVSTIYIAKGMTIEDQDNLPSDCTVVSLSSNPSYDFQIDCMKNQLDGFASTTYAFQLKISDPSITQKKYGILAASASVAYVRISGENEKIRTGGRYLTAYRGAEIRSEYNPDPSSFYPLKGEGVYIDNVLTAENKEDTNADDVEHIAVIPLISPVVDGNNQGSLAYTLEFYNDYYQSRKASSSFIFPFLSTDNENRDYDFLDYKSLKCTNAVLSADWDTPVKTILMNRLESGLPATIGCGESIDNIVGKDYAYSVNNDDIVAKQLYYADSDNYYEHATQRQLVYIDTSKESGAADYYGGNIPPEIVRGSVAKKNLIFARNDIYFYPNKNYPLPEGIEDGNVFLSIDRYGDECGDDQGILQAGYFNDTLDNGIAPNIYDNALTCRQDRTKISIDEIADYSGQKIRLSHYLFPIAAEDQISQASDLAHFDTASGTYEYYPEVKFIRAHSVDFTLDQSITPKGGRFEFVLPADVHFTDDPITNDLVTFSADHVAVREIAYDESSNKIVVDFIRGKMPDETNGKPDVLRLNLENLDTEQDIGLNTVLYRLDYDLGQPDNLAVYTQIDFADILIISPKPFLSLPSLIMKFRLKRGVDNEQSYFQKYEYFEPFVRYGVYIQELLAHRTVYAYTENHPVSDPGLVLANASFSTFSNIGASSIPFREYLQTGVKQVIPSSPETARVDYLDIWKRQWSTPIRTVMPDVPPIPPPLRNFMMNTTFEMRDQETGERQLEWDSDRQAEVLYKIKLLNNYPKYFEPTVCKDNEVLIRANVNDLLSKYFVAPDSDSVYTATDTVSNLYLHRANVASYGVCYQSEGDMMSNQVLSSEQREEISDVALCASGDDCLIASSSLPVISRRPDGDEGSWNYSQAVENYFPNDYIDESMWSLTHYDYADDAFSKGYMYHLDNLLPNIDNIRKGILRPHNIVAQPVYKGLGYSLSYDPEYESRFFSVEGDNIIGWRSDNLQNKDDTLLAGQGSVNNVSVDKNSLLDNSNIIRIDQLQESTPYRDAAMSNIYACLFNRWRARIDPVNGNVVYPDNVYINNVVPIGPDLDKNDIRLTDYDCDDLLYTPDTIHQFDNVVQTDAKDWLYFGVGLRGGAKETINIVSNLSPIDGVRYEGFAKINDGGRFTYWNPANGPNSFLVLDNVVNVVEAIQSRLAVSKEIIPVEVPTFNADIYHLITIYDLDEANREFTESPYLKHYGFGDAVTAVQVGVANNLKANGSILSPGDNTTIKIELFNNSGYDWNLIKSSSGELAIESSELESAAISANDLLNKTKHSIRQPIRFNFLNFVIPSEISNYIEISPSTHNIATPGILFDFDNINVTTIRDGFKGSYYLDLTVNSNFPDDLRGRTFDIGVVLQPEFFDRYPGHQYDPVEHDYSLSLPSIRFGVPYDAGNGDKTGKVYRASGYSSDISLIDEMPLGVEPQTIKRINWAESQSFRAIANDPEHRQNNLDSLYSNDNFGQIFSFAAEETASGTKRITVSLADNGIAQFPIPQNETPDLSTLYLLIKSHSEHLPFGENRVNQNLRAAYEDNFSFAKISRMSDPQYRIARAAGADLQANYTADIIGESTGERLEVQKLSPDDDNLIRLNVRLENIGSAIAYRPVAQVFVPAGLEIASGSISDVLSHATTTEVRLPIGRDMGPGDVELLSFVIRQQHEDIFSFNLVPIVNAAESEVEIVNHAAAEFDLTATPDENHVSQDTAGSFFMEYADSDNPSLTISAVYIEKNVFLISLSPQNLNNPYFQLFRRDAGGDFTTVGGYQSTSTYQVDISDGGSYFYGALYDRVLTVNDQGEEVYDYQKLAESNTISIDYDSRSFRAMFIDTTPPRKPTSSSGRSMDFVISTINEAGQEIKETVSQKIQLSLDGGLDAVKMAISEFEDFRQASLETYKKLADWTLSGGIGVKKIFARFYTKNGVKGAATSTEIVLLPLATSTQMNIATSSEDILPLHMDIGDEAKKLRASPFDLDAYILGLRKKKNVESQIYGMNKFIKGLNPSKQLKKEEVYAMNNFIIYGTESTTKKSWDERFQILLKYQKKNGKLPISQNDWADILIQ